MCWERNVGERNIRGLCARTSYPDSTLFWCMYIKTGYRRTVFFSHMFLNFTHLFICKEITHYFMNGASPHLIREMPII